MAYGELLVSKWRRNAKNLGTSPVAVEAFTSRLKCRRRRHETQNLAYRSVGRES